MASANTAVVDLRALQRKAESNRILLKTLFSRFKETETQRRGAPVTTIYRQEGTLPVEPVAARTALQPYPSIANIRSSAEMLG